MNVRKTEKWWSTDEATKKLLVISLPLCCVLTNSILTYSKKFHISTIFGTETVHVILPFATHSYIEQVELEHEFDFFKLNELKLNFKLIYLSQDQV